MTTTGTIASSAMNAAYVVGLRTSAKASSTILAKAPSDVVNADDGVIDDERDRHSEPSKCERVERFTAQVEHERRRYQRQRDRHQADQRGAPREQEDGEDEDQENTGDDVRKP